MDNESAPSFDRATYAPGVRGGASCSHCKVAIRERYWRANDKIFCAVCRGQIAAAIEGSRAKASFGKAVLLGGAVALACGIGYAIFVQASGMQLALVTIGIAWAVAKTVRSASGALGGRRFQILAVLLTYVGSAMGYAGPVLHAFRDRAEKRAEKKNADDEADSPSTSKADKPAAGAGMVLVAVLLTFGFILAAPILVAPHAPIGLVIVLIGLWQAWKLSRPITIVLDGPYNVGSGAPPSL
jgi:hypothetical protein